MAPRPAPPSLRPASRAGSFRACASRASSVVVACVFARNDNTPRATSGFSQSISNAVMTPSRPNGVLNHGMPAYGITPVRCVGHHDLQIRRRPFEPAVEDRAGTRQVAAERVRCMASRGLLHCQRVVERTSDGDAAPTRPLRIRMLTSIAAVAIGSRVSIHITRFWPPSIGTAVPVQLRASLAIVQTAIAHQVPSSPSSGSRSPRRARLVPRTSKTSAKSASK